MRKLSAAPFAALLLAGCATAPGTDRLAQRDPLEKVNRGIWGVNQAIDKVLLKPVTVGYRAVFPRPVRSGVTHFFSNVSEPWSMINNLLQGSPKRAARSLKRFVINTTIGVGGLGDPATKMGVKPAPEDFGQTLAKWGVNAGPYLVLPLLGPSTLRDTVGTGVGFLADPYRVCLNYCGLPDGVPTGLTVAYTIDVRSQLIDSGADAFLATSADPYATARSAYLQQREAAIANKDDTGGAGDEAAGTASPDAALDAALKDYDASNGGAADAGSAPRAVPAGEAANPAGGTTGSSSDDAAIDDAINDMDQSETPPTAPATPQPQQPR